MTSQQNPVTSTKKEDWDCDEVSAYPNPAISRQRKGDDEIYSWALDSLEMAETIPKKETQKKTENNLFNSTM